MAPKPRKSMSQWYKCDQCQSLITQKNVATHLENSCPPPSDNWTYGFIKNSVLHSTLEECSYNDILKSLPKKICGELVFLSQTAMQLCNLCIGEPAMIAAHDGVVTVRIAWPTQDGSLTSVFMSRDGLEATCMNPSCLIMVKKLNTVPKAAQEVYITSFSPNVQVPETLLQHHFLGTILGKGCKFRIPYYGKTLTFRVNDIKPVIVGRCTVPSQIVVNDLSAVMNSLQIEDTDETDDIADTDDTSSVDSFFKVIQGTKWHTMPNTKTHRGSEERVLQKPLGIAALGGMQAIINNIQQLMSLTLEKSCSIPGIKKIHGILLYGPAGVGKTMLSEALASESGATVYRIWGAEVYSRFVGDSEAKIRNIFEQAIQNAPSLILLDEVDVLCPRQISGGLEQERRVVATMATQLDRLRDASVMFIATSSHPDAIDPSLRRPGRFDHEIEIPVPSPEDRVCILQKILSDIPHTLLDTDIKAIAQAAHGFVGADLAALCSQAVHHASISKKNLNVADVSWALTQVKPSAMREVLLHIPNVRWSDVGGQRALKLHLRQAVEWPLKHPEAFHRLGINPPRGVLLFGPPGCSKTLVAKALATESKLNFISIKGPELFSKWVGESERAVREVFRRARQLAPAIVFLDELDALGSERTGGGSGSGNSVQERVVAQLLTELDGVEPLGDVTILAATNRPDRIDKALLRPGRLDRVVYVPLPDHDTRADILSIQLHHMPTSSDVDVNQLAAQTEGYSGAELVAVCHEAALAALEQDLQAILVTQDHFNIALNIVTPRTPTSLLQLYERYLGNTS